MEHGKIKTLLPFLLIIALTATSAAQGGLPIENVEMAVGQERDINLSIENQLPLEDRIRLTFKGRAISESLVQIEVEENGDIECADDYITCNVTVPGRSTRQVGITLQASQSGQEELIIEGTSRETQLTGDDSLTISTNPLSREGQVSAPGMTGPYLGLVAGAAALLLFFYTRNK